ncbi:hypothetical protein BAE44_0021328 [Dichanthelium oligosanthes]|uniref:DUF1618 domain-containing protein n=1 Tax=Dichanthelium oligosanthes TaxID=888268 RepID=A0A1E5UXY4_9POAL|nr:hypothetical protein BAE44_0021328 [Dichanthelium oligosanthes]
MSAPPEAPESSRAREGHAEEAAEPSGEAPQRRRWVVLSSLPGGAHRLGDQRHRNVLPGTDLLLDLHDPPRLSSLVLRANLTELHPEIYVADSASARLLLKASKGDDTVANPPQHFLCDARARTADRLPTAHFFRLGGPDSGPLGYLDLYPLRSIGLIADPGRHGHFVVAQLHPIPTARFHTLLYYYTATRRWATKPLAYAPGHDHRRWGAHGVFAHDGLLWWIDIAYGMLVCNPFDDTPRLRLVPLPPGCGLQHLEHIPRRTRALLDQRRCIRPSEGKLRYVEIRGFSYDTSATAAEPPINPAVVMWTLVDPDAQNPWNLEYEAPFDDIWAHDTYVDAGLPQDQVPHVALVDPDDHGVVYLFQGSWIFGLDVRQRRVVASDRCLIDEDPKQRFQSTRFVDAWVPPPTLPGRGDDPSTHDGNPPKLTYDEEKDCKIEYVQSWLNQMELTSQVEEGNSSGEQMSTVEDMAPPSEPSPDAGHQADEP